MLVLLKLFVEIIAVVVDAVGRNLAVIVDVVGRDLAVVAVVVDRDPYCCC